MSQRISWGFSKKPVTPSATVTVLSPDLLNLLSMDISSSSRLIDDLTHEEGEHDDGYVGTLKEITKQHWKSAESSKACQNKECRKVFSTVLERPHHCRRCGEVFCADCLKYKRRLNKLAHFDPDGDLYKVCKSCFELDKTTEGQVRNHSKDFAALRTAHKFVSTTEANGAVPSARRSQLDYDVEYERLTKGFAGSIGSSEIKKTLHELRSVLSTPDWMKSSVWIQENLASFCQFCKGDFGLMKKKAFCRVCGKCVCKSCSTKDLLVYVPDGEREKGVKCSPKLAIIKYVGCPEVEPEISLYLRVCKHCKDRLVDKQVRLEEEEDQLSNGPDFLEALIRVHQKLVKAELGVKDQLPKYRDVVDSLEDGTRRTNLQSNTKILAKAQGDLADVLAQHVTIVQQLKKLKPQTETQASLLKTYIRAKCDFYLEHQAQFRALKHKLCESVPAESLDFIQRIMDKNPSPPLSPDVEPLRATSVSSDTSAEGYNKHTSLPEAACLRDTSPDRPPQDRGRSASLPDGGGAKSGRGRKGLLKKLQRRRRRTHDDSEGHDQDANEGKQADPALPAPGEAARLASCA
ncbi:vacuolar segregation protein PEP7 isoform X2 [Aplysia californica]|uniref:Vacuolar segregation protein PEP7 isoform X2 n=1 Tax=Aplysia californica TaxID=6500 RepID=A0ABM1A7F4_APLCA|nr:vacuolar segregation protein PEP7 isoform X2 [Aplysia californica]